MNTGNQELTKQLQTSNLEISHLQTEVFGLMENTFSDRENRRQTDEIQ